MNQVPIIYIGQLDNNIFLHHCSVESMLVASWAAETKSVKMGSLIAASISRAVLAGSEEFTSDVIIARRWGFAKASQTAVLSDGNIYDIWFTSNKKWILIHNNVTHMFLIKGTFFLNKETTSDVYIYFVRGGTHLSWNLKSMNTPTAGFCLQTHGEIFYENAVFRSGSMAKRILNLLFTIRWWTEINKEWATV